MAYDGYNDKLGDPNTNVGMRARAVRRLRGLRMQRGSWEPIWSEIARFCSPKISRWINAYSSGNYVQDVDIKLRDTLNSKLLDARAVWASEVLGNGMHSGLTSPSRPWFKLTLSDKDLAEFQAVKEWLDVVEARLYDFFNHTNFYTAIKGGYHDLGTFGCEAAFMESHWKYGGVTHPMAVGEYWLGVDTGLVTDSLYRRIDMTVIQHYQRFEKGRLANGKRAIDILPIRVVEDYDRGNYDALHPVYHAVEPNDLRDPSKIDGKNKAFRSLYWSARCSENEAADENKALLAFEGYNSKPFWAARWDVKGSGDTYSTTSPGLNALADVRQLQLGVLRKQQAIDFGIKPPLRGPATLNNLHVALQPGRITAMAGVDKDSFGPIWQIDPSMIQYVMQDNTETRDAVDRGFYADLFNAITNMAGIQPRNVEEIASRNEEKLTQLGPVVERVNQEKLQVAIDRAYDILDAAGVLPPPPEELHGVRIDVEFISVLAQAQRMIGLGAIERTAGYISSVMQAKPDIVDTFDFDESVREYGDITGVASKLLRSKDLVDKDRAARAQQQAQAQQAEQMAQMAPAAKDGAQAAQLLMDSPGTGGGASLAQRLLGA